MSPVPAGGQAGPPGWAAVAWGGRDPTAHGRALPAGAVTSRDVTLHAAGWRGPSPPWRAGDGVWAPLTGFNPFPRCPWLCPRPCCSLCLCLPEFPWQDQLLSPACFLPAVSPACTGAREEPPRPRGSCVLQGCDSGEHTPPRLHRPLGAASQPGRARAIGPFTPSSNFWQGTGGLMGTEGQLVVGSSKFTILPWRQRPELTWEHVG